MNADLKLAGGLAAMLTAVAAVVLPLPDPVRGTILLAALVVGTALWLLS